MSSKGKNLLNKRQNFFKTTKTSAPSLPPVSCHIEQKVLSPVRSKAETSCPLRKATSVSFTQRATHLRHRILEYESARGFFPLWSVLSVSFLFLQRAFEAPLDAIQGLMNKS